MLTFLYNLFKPADINSGRKPVEQPPLPGRWTWMWFGGNQLPTRSLSGDNGLKCPTWVTVQCSTTVVDPPTYWVRFVDTVIHFSHEAVARDYPGVVSLTSIQFPSREAAMMAVELTGECAYG